MLSPNISVGTKKAVSRRKFDDMLDADKIRKSVGPDNRSDVFVCAWVGPPFVRVR